MRGLIGLLGAVVVLVTQAATAAELYKCKGDNGETVFSDQPCPGGETLPMRETPTYEALPPPARLPPIEDKAKKPDQIAYKLAITSPAVDDVIRDNEGKLQVQGTVSPALYEDHRVQLLLDGQPVGKPQQAPSWSLDDVERGEHSLVLAVVYKDGKKTVASSAPVKFVLFRASANHPANPGSSSATDLPDRNRLLQANWPQLQDAPQPGDPKPTPPTKPPTSGPRK